MSRMRWKRQTEHLITRYAGASPQGEAFFRFSSLHHLIMLMQSVAAQDGVGRGEQQNGEGEEQEAVVGPHVAQRILLRCSVAEKIGRDKGVDEREADVRLPEANAAVEAIKHGAQEHTDADGQVDIAAHHADEQKQRREKHQRDHARDQHIQPIRRGDEQLDDLLEVGQVHLVKRDVAVEQNDRGHTEQRVADDGHELGQHQLCVAHAADQSQLDLVVVGQEEGDGDEQEQRQHSLAVFQKARPGLGGEQRLRLPHAGDHHEQDDRGDEVPGKAPPVVAVEQVFVDVLCPCPRLDRLALHDAPHSFFVPRGAAVALTARGQLVHKAFFHGLAQGAAKQLHVT